MTYFTLKTFYPDGKEEVKDFLEDYPIKEMQAIVDQYKENGTDDSNAVYFWVWSNKACDDGFGTWEHEVWVGEYGRLAPQYSWKCVNMEDYEVKLNQD